MREMIKDKVWWHIYILELDNKGHKVKGLSFNKCFYTGITSRGLGVRLGDYLFNRGRGYVNDRWHFARKTPVYVEYFYGNEFEAQRREKVIKNMCVDEKILLIKSDKNMIKEYIPLKAIILVKNKVQDERVAIKIQ